MEQKTHQRFRSGKKIIQAKDLMIGKKYRLPRSFGNERDPDNGKLCCLVITRDKKYFLPVEEDIDIDEIPFSIMLDSAAYRDVIKYELCGFFDPVQL